MAATPFTLFHVVISLIGILSGAVVVFGFLAGKKPKLWTVTFLITSVVTSATGFGFPFHGLEPPHIVGIISLLILALAIPALYKFHLNGSWRTIYVIGAVSAWYLNLFVLVVQLFLKVPMLKSMAPTQKEPPFAIAQVAVFLLVLTLGVLSVKNFRTVPA